MGRNAVNPLQGIQRDGGCAEPWIGGCFQKQVAVVKFLQRIHDHCRAGDIAGLGFQGGDLGGFDRRTGIDRKSGMDLRQQILHEGFCQAFGLVQTQKEEAAEQLQDSRRVQRRERQKCSIG